MFLKYFSINIKKYYYNFKITVFFSNILKCNAFPVRAKLNIQHHYSSLHCHIILQKSYADLLLKKYIYIYIYICLFLYLYLLAMLKTVVPFNICMVTVKNNNIKIQIILTNYI